MRAEEGAERGERPDCSENGEAPVSWKAGIVIVSPILQIRPLRPSELR